MDVKECINDFLEVLGGKYYSFLFLQLGNKGEFNGRNSHCFTEASCGVKLIPSKTIGISKEAIKFKDVFPSGISFLEKLGKGDKEMQSTAHDTAYNILNQYFIEKDQHEKSLKQVLHHNNSELDITVALSEHLLGKLSPGKSYVIDERSKKKQNCKCGFEHCKGKPEFGRTGLGHENVWHGSVDIVFGSHEGLEGQSIATICSFNQPESESMSESTDATESESTPSKKQRIDDTDEDSSSSSPGGRSIAEVKKTPIEFVANQPIAETIVFSLLQKQRHPDHENHLIPNICIDENHFRIFMYDADGDFLISTIPLPLFVEGSLDPLSVICLWMVLHYRIFCTKIQAEERLKSRFRELVADEWEIYSKRLKFRVASFHIQVEAILPSIEYVFHYSKDSKFE